MLWRLSWIYGPARSPNRTVHGSYFRFPSPRTGGGDDYDDDNEDDNDNNDHNAHQIPLDTRWKSLYDEEGACAPVDPTTTTATAKPTHPTMRAIARIRAVRPHPADDGPVRFYQFVRPVALHAKSRALHATTADKITQLNKDRK